MNLIKIILLIAGIIFVLSTISFGQGPKQVKEIYDQIKKGPLDEKKVAQVEGLVMKRDAAVFRLNQGQICLFQPIQGKVTGAVFMGDGIFEFSPPTEIEKYQLRRFTNQDSLSQEFTQLYLLFSDTTDMELEHKLTFSEGKVQGEFSSIKKHCPGQVIKDTNRNLWSRLLADVIADSSFVKSCPDRGTGFFYADINTKLLGDLFFTFDPKEIEEVLLEKSYWRPGEDGRDRVCSFHQASDYQKNQLPKNTPIQHEEKNEIKITHYKINASLTIKEELSAFVRIDFESLVDGIRVIDFKLHPDLKMAKVTNDQADSLLFIQEKEHPQVSVILSHATRKGETHQLIFEYAEYSGREVMDEDIFGNPFIRSTTHWYPRYKDQTRASYDLTFKSPKDYKLVSIGEKADEWIEGDSSCTHWVEDFPVGVASFNYGSFKIYKTDSKEVPEVSVYYLGEKKAKEDVAADVVNSLKFFQTVYGKCPFSRIAVTETPAYSGQGLPGLIQLPHETFTAYENLEEIRFDQASFRAHEVAHQWWGHLVTWETYHDQWLSEGFAEYSGAWYAQMITKNNEEFFNELIEWQNDILGKGYKWEEGSMVGPIWLGVRLNSSKSSDYGNLIYKKGAFVLHMLRNMMIDYDSNSDERFQKMMADFVANYQGKNASTEDFQAVVEKHVGEEMDWFFDQWVYGIEVPTYVFSYTTEKTPDGKYLVNCDISQEDVSKDFKMWVPVLLEFAGDQYAVQRLWVDKPHNVFQLPKAPLMPRRVILNPAHAVLCEVKTRR